MKKLVIGLASIILFFTFSCKKGSEPTNLNSNPKSALRGVDEFDFDQFGISHNNFLLWMDSNNAAEMDDSSRHALALTYIDEYFGDCIILH